MKLTVAALSYSLLNVPVSLAQSGESQYISRQLDEGWRALQRSQTLGSIHAFAALSRLAQECENANWDGYGAAPVSQRGIEEASAVIRSLPLGFPQPDTSADFDGHVTLEWYRSPTRTLAVSVSPDGLLHYAAIIGASRQFGTEPFLGPLPERLTELVRRVMQA